MGEGGREGGYLRTLCRLHEGGERTHLYLTYFDLIAFSFVLLSLFYNVLVRFVFYIKNSPLLKRPLLKAQLEYIFLNEDAFVALFLCSLCSNILLWNKPKSVYCSLLQHQCPTFNRSDTGRQRECPFKRLTTSVFVPEISNFIVFANQTVLL